MTKTLTEQYKFGEIKTGYYWCKIWGEDALVIKWLVEDNEIHQPNLIEEVLAPVPSYDEWKELDDELKELSTKNDTLAMENGKLTERLAIATKALKQYKEDYFITTYGGRFVNPYPDIARKALKEMEGVK